MGCVGQGGRKCETAERELRHRARHSDVLNAAASACK